MADTGQTQFYLRLFHEFLSNGESLRVYEGDRMVFASSKDRLVPLLEYIDEFASGYQQVVIFDKIIGNAAALLSIMAGCKEIYSPLGSQQAIETLKKYGIEYHFSEIVPLIQKVGGEGICPMEKLSLGKDPEEFYRAIKGAIGASKVAK